MSLPTLSLAATAILVARQLYRSRQELAHVQPDPASPTTPPPVLKRTPRISVFTIAYAEDEDPAALVDNFARIDYPNKELLLAIGGVHKIEQYRHLENEDVILVQHPGGWKNVALARSFERATGEIIVFTDGDAHYVGDSFLRLVEPIINDGEVAAIGTAQPPRELMGNWVVEMHRSRSTNRQRDRLYAREALTGANSAATRAALAKIGNAFDAAVIGDDYWRAHRLMQEGFRIRRVPDAIVEMQVPGTVAAYIRQQSRWLRSWYIDSPRLGRPGETLRGLRAAAEGTAMFSLTALLPFSSTARWLMLPVMPHLYLNRLRRLIVSSRRGRFRLRPVHLIVPLAQCYIDFTICVRALVEYLVPRWRYRW